MEIAFAAIVFVVQTAILGGIAYAIYAWVRRGNDSESEPDPGMGTLKRIYFYGISFAALMTCVAGISLALQSLLNTLFDGQALSLSTSSLAWGLSLLIVGLPIWWFHWRYILRSVAEMPFERGSVIRKLYIYISLGVALGFLMGTAYEILKWAMLAGEFPEFSLASILPWAMVWGYHWQMESAEARDSAETRAIRRLYLYAVSFVGAIMFAVGAGSMVHALLEDGYAALFLVTVALPDQSGLARESLRTDLAVAVVGVVAYWTHWRRFAGGDRDSMLRWIFLLMMSVGGAATALASGGIIVFTTLEWLFGAASGGAESHFEDVPGALVVGFIGLAAWIAFRRRMLAEAIGGYCGPIRRIYDHLMAALGLIALGAASFMIFNTALVIFADSLSDVIRDSGAWRSPLAAIVAAGVIGVPVWGVYWRRLRLAAAENPSVETTALPHRVYVFAVMGAGALAFLVGGGGALFVILRDLLDADVSLETMRDLAPAMGAALTAALFLPYHWAIYRDSQAYLPDSRSEKPAIVRKRVTILTPDRDSALAAGIGDALGYAVREARWSDPEAFAPSLDTEEMARIADEISQSDGSSVLLIPEGDGLRVISHD